MVKTRMNALKNEEEVKEVVDQLVNDSIDEKSFDFAFFAVCCFLFSCEGCFVSALFVCMMEKKLVQ